ncbi:sigma-54-dependent transcriptional regulator [Allorhodopirellula solitaria]|uniref:DNA-binding transcriptional regulator NtrC n=1 Tax=Allorhodopirellula solitaria TaxID=2527987 RepID=A0A5C5XU69_9BACT|nr:sigma-54 dependent transcriptional regulator [Allorhodopirellula solitaria]TWT65142.1 Nitrogen regulation protein NR(I) [Allorhodopirellula solitaria]
MRNVLIVDDEPNVLCSFEKAICQRREDIQITTADNGVGAIAAFERSVPDAVILNACLPDMSGLDVFKHFHHAGPAVPVIVVTAHASTDLAIEATKQGAFDFLVKPVDIEHLRSVIDRSLQHSERADPSGTFSVEGSKQPVEGMIGQSPAMQSVYKSIGRVAPENVTVLILGESGTGKELVATEIFRHSQRRSRPFLVINCAALSETLLESELFGHEKGAFTGADARHEGKFERAHGGTLFLDELGDMNLATQAKVLRVLQDGKFERVGGSQTIATDVRLVCATNHDLEQQIKQGLFRQDLLYRLNGFTIPLPPLRERSEDLPLLIEHFLNRSNRKFARQVTKIAPAAMQQLLDYSWPGNIRELQSVMQFTVLHSIGDTLTVDSLPDLLPPNQRRRDEAAEGEPNVETGQGREVEATERTTATSSGPSGHLPDVADRVHELIAANEPNVFRNIIDDTEQVVIHEVLKHFHGNQVQASRALGISRTTLRGKILRE